MSTSKESSNIFALSAVSQANYQTDLAGNTVTKNYRQIDKNDRNFAKYSVATSDNKGHSTGTPYPTRKEIESHDVTFTLTEDLSSQLLPERAKAGMGILESEETVEDEVYTHTAKLLNPQDNSQQPAYGYVEKAGESASRPNARNNKYPSCVCGQFAVKGSGKAVLQSTTTWNGSGKRIKPSGIKFFGANNHVILLEEMVNNYFKNTMAKLRLFPQKELGGSAFQVGCAFRDFEVSVNQQLLLEAGYLGCGLFQTAGNSNSGAIRGKAEVGEQAVQFNFTIIDDDAYDAYEYLQEMKSMSADLKYEGSDIITVEETTYKHSALWKLIHGNIVDIDPTTVDGENALRITTEPLALGQIMPVELVVVNNVASYSIPSW